jgi:hypothetical protein
MPRGEIVLRLIATSIALERFNVLDRPTNRVELMRTPSKVLTRNISHSTVKTGIVRRINRQGAKKEKDKVSF